MYLYKASDGGDFIAKRLQPPPPARIVLGQTVRMDKGNDVLVPPQECFHREASLERLVERGSSSFLPGTKKTALTIHTVAGGFRHV